MHFLLPSVMNVMILQCKISNFVIISYYILLYYNIIILYYGWISFFI